MTDRATFADGDLFHIKKGNPDAGQLAAVLLVLLSRTAACGAEPDDVPRHRRPRARWLRPERTPRSPGPGSWRTPPSGHTANGRSAPDASSSERNA